MGTNNLYVGWLFHFCQEIFRWPFVTKDVLRNEQCFLDPVNSVYEPDPLLGVGTGKTSPAAYYPRKFLSHEFLPRVAYKNNFRWM